MAGLEPTISESKSGVLPLHYIPLSLLLRMSPAHRAHSLWGGIWGSNPRHPEPQSGALPTELIPPYLARQEGFEPPTYCLEGSCSILLSYWRMCAAPAHVERVMGIEPTYPAWKAGVLPLNHTCKVPRTGIEPVTRGFSVLCSTN